MGKGRFHPVGRMRKARVPRTHTRVGRGGSLLRQSLHVYFLGNGKPYRLFKGRETPSEFFFRNMFLLLKEANTEVWSPVRRPREHPGSYRADRLKVSPEGRFTQ